ncbi:hypothetical protein CAI16_12170 [Virgibacillus dokdonensis]|uniref:DUF3139 domain-containing protein n=1 Tax=Virgibacillus dokdonensis TaxID=302167 RepID=A0A3E0WQG2_9BACI|nr:hypothetical protein [Virgibacillus dokdonensis]RFA34236.1 hypothetical protein CAI16_12170 [Virgibacillus dokdonensis]
MKKRKIFMLLFAISISLNVYLVGKSFVMKQLIEPTAEEEVTLSEMVQKTVESEDYKQLAKKEDIIAIQAGVDKFKGGAFPYTLEVSVKTDKQAYLFYCRDDRCSQVENGGWTYSIYQDEKPRLP